MGVRASKLSKVMGGSGRPKSPILTPKGYVPVSVGLNNETQRFMVHTRALGDADFLELLCRSAEEYGFYYQGILRIPYEAKDFEEWMRKGDKLNIFRVRPS